MLTHQYFIIDRIVVENESIRYCYLEEQEYDKINKIREWKAVNRMLVDSEEQQLIYVIEGDGEWQHVRFPISVWKDIDAALVLKQEVYLVTAINEAGESVATLKLSDFREECRELLINMVQNVNYGEELFQLAEEHFHPAIRFFTKGE